ncbi:WD repeat-containing protein 55 isoform X2 [Crotalus tigris]|uniref:WD repeat-containing protein 55 isoform X2 n=1 Tax=Crotalus tigris TaxID=88082 RepID=UPI00192F9C77|nr:WD repeat-containing protein 55 isoform X2 [Crotalus tigris]
MAAPDTVHSDEEELGLEPRLHDTPEDIFFEAAANTIDFHPSQDIIAIGDVDGDVYVYSYSCLEGGNKELWSSGHHLKSCRKISFSQDGQRDDSGVLKVWDLRKGTSIMEMKQHEDYISDMIIDRNKKLLLTTSGDGTMGVFNIRRRRFELLSEPQNGDLMAISLMKRGRKVACGSSEGTIYLFNWDGFGATSDRFALKAESIDCMVPITESIVCTGSTDGIIRAVNILPNRVIGSVGQHMGEPVEQLAKCHTGQFLASCAHDQKVKFWDISSLSSVIVDDYRKKKKNKQLKPLSRKAFGNGEDFFADLKAVAADLEKENDGLSETDSD